MLGNSPHISFLSFFRITVSGEFIFLKLISGGEGNCLTALSILLRASRPPQSAYGAIHGASSSHTLGAGLRFNSPHLMYIAEFV
jgi:hypothetical protein